MLALDEKVDYENTEKVKISQSKPTKTSAQLYDEIILREKIRRWEKKYFEAGYLLKKYYKWRKKI